MPRDFTVAAAHLNHGQRPTAGRDVAFVEELCRELDVPLTVERADVPALARERGVGREARDPFELMENIEEILGIKTYPMNWPIGCGKEFKGVFDRNARKVLAFSSDGRANGVKKVSETEAELGDPALDELLTPYLHQQLVDEIELLDGAAEEFDLDKVLRGELSPVFFGSALTNFGVEPFLENFLRLTSAPLARVDSLTGEPVDPCRDEFSAFIFKIQANMNKATATVLPLCASAPASSSAAWRPTMCRRARTSSWPPAPS